MKKRFALILACLMICLVAVGCAKANDSAAVEKAPAVMGDVADSDMVLTDKTETTSQTVAADRKLVRKIWLDTETENMDALLTGINKQVAELGGYVEARNVYNGSQYDGHRYRSAELTIRIPADRLDAFVQHMADNANITSNRETSEDITLTYVATQSRITALETEETRLLELLAEAKNMDDLLQIESRLTVVRTELEQVKSQLRVYENQVDYGTIYLTLNEVKEYTVVEEPETVWERIAAGFKNSLKNLGEFFTELFVVLVVGLPYLVMIAIPVTAVILLIRHYRKKRPKKKEE